MGVLHTRRRIADRTPEGGGLTEPSLTDTATDDDIYEHESGDGPSGDLGDVELDYDDRYGPFTATDGLADTYTAEEARADASQFADKPFSRAEVSRDVAQEWRPGVLNLAAGADAYIIAGADPLRKCITIKNVTTNAIVDSANVHLGNDSSLPVVPGPGAYLLRQGVIDPATGVSRDGDELTLTHTGPVWVIVANYGVANLPARITYAIERYYK
jgi:hypothetical protein